MPPVSQRAHTHLRLHTHRLCLRDRDTLLDTARTSIFLCASPVMLSFVSYVNPFFSYFSHHTITIPPPPWISCCHANGTAVLGTIIFEWEAGATKCRKILQKNADGSLSQAALAFCNNLVFLCCQMHFDGYLINVECSLTTDEIAVLIEWLSLIRSQLKSRIPHSLLIWYDAVTVDGQLVWQNALNAKNKPFFDVCDAIFLNYAWDQAAASSSAAAAGGRACDMFLGVDVFGRGTFGGGKFNSHAAAAMAQVCRAAIHCAFHLLIARHLPLRWWGAACRCLLRAGRTSAPPTVWTSKSTLHPRAHLSESSRTTQHDAQLRIPAVAGARVEAAG